jgi:hypothetical protein
MSKRWELIVVLALSGAAIAVAVWAWVHYAEMPPFGQGNGAI